MPGKTPFLAVGLSVTGAILLAIRFYFVRELLILLAALAVLFAVGTGAVLLVVLLKEGERWSVRQIIEAKQRTIMLQGGPSFQIPVLTTVNAANSMGKQSGEYQIPFRDGSQKEKE